MNESSATRALNAKVKALGVYAWKIHTTFNKGVPDCWYSGPARDLWAEVKWLPKPPKNKLPDKLSALQKKWLAERSREGRNVAVVYLWPGGGTILKVRATMEIQQLFTMKFEPFSLQQLAEAIRTEVAYADQNHGRREEKPP